MLPALLFACSASIPTGGHSPLPADSSADSGIELACPEEIAPPELPDAWTPASPPPGGDLHTFASSPAEPERIYAGSTMNGVYRSDDSGSSWTRTRVLLTHVYGQLAVSDTDPDLLAYPAKELYLSEDGGASWSQVSAGDDLEIQGLAFDGRVLFAATLDGEVLRSEDLGESFAAAGSLPARRHGGGERGDELWVPEPGDWSLDFAGGSLFALQHQGDLWRSEDGGATWELSRAGAHVFDSLAWNGTVLAVAEDEAVLLSEDGGASWEAEPPGPEGILGIALGPSNELAAAGEDAVWVRSGGGWTRLDPPGYAPPAAVAWSDDGALLVGHREGLLRSGDSGGSWDDVSDGLVDLDLSTLLVHPACPNLVLAGTQCERGVYRTEDWGASWSHVTTYMHYVMVLEANPSRPEELWITTDDRVFRSRDLGASWDELEPSWMRVHLHGLGIDPYHPGTVLVGSVGSGLYADERARVFRTDDGGQSWSESDEGIPDSPASAHAIHFVRSREGVVLLGGFRGGDIDHTGDPGFGLYRSTDGGRSWEATGLEARDVSRMAECGGRVYAATDAGLALSDDAGESWRVALVADDEFLAVACRGDTVLALDGLRRVHRSDDRGESFTDWSDPTLPDPVGADQNRLHDIAISADGSTALVALRGFGMYLRPL